MSSETLEEWGHANVDLFSRHVRTHLEELTDLDRDTVDMLHRMILTSLRSTKADGVMDNPDADPTAMFALYLGATIGGIRRADVISWLQEQGVTEEQMTDFVKAASPIMASFYRS